MMLKLIIFVWLHRWHAAAAPGWGTAIMPDRRRLLTLSRRVFLCVYVAVLLCDVWPIDCALMRVCICYCYLELIQGLLNSVTKPWPSWAPWLFITRYTLVWWRRRRRWWWWWYSVRTGDWIYSCITYKNSWLRHLSVRNHCKSVFDNDLEYKKSIMCLALSTTASFHDYRVIFVAATCHSSSVMTRDKTDIQPQPGQTADSTINSECKVSQKFPM